MTVEEQGAFNEIDYTPEFEALVSENPGLLKSFLDIQKQINESTNLHLNDCFEKNGVKVSLCYQHPEKGFHYFKVSFEGKDFFVKSVNGIDDASGDGVFEKRSLEALKKDIEEIEGVHVVDVQFAIQKDKTSYLVSKWIEGKTLKDLCRYFEEQGMDLSDDNWQYMWELREKMMGLRTRFQDRYLDIHEGNIIVEAATGDLYLFDIFKKRR
jgi:hypothetical protein